MTSSRLSDDELMAILASNESDFSEDEEVGVNQARLMRLSDHCQLAMKRNNRDS